MQSWDVNYIGKVEQGEGTKSFRFEKPGDCDYLPGQFFIITIPSGDSELVHHFSYSSSPTEPFLEYTTRMREGSDFKNTMDQMQEGATVKIQSPLGMFTVKEDMKKVAYLSGGIGVTPARSTIRWAIDTHSDIDILLIYANRHLSNLAFREEFDNLTKENIRVVYIISQPEEDWAGLKGRINADVIRSTVTDWNDRDFFVSGPPDFAIAVQNALVDDVGLSMDKVNVEQFTGY